MAPAIAAAAALAGLARWVRARGPWRPMKLRLEVETERWPGATDFAVGREAHRAAGLAPFEAGLGEELVEPFGHRVALDGLGARHHPGADAGRDLAAARDFGGGAQIAEAAVGAGADEDPIDRRAGDRRAGLQPHVVERGLQRGTARRIVDRLRIGNVAVDADDMLGADAPGHLRFDPGDVDRDFLVEHGVRDRSAIAATP